MKLTESNLARLEERFGELLADREAVGQDLSRYRDRPVEFMREVLGFEPWEKQVEICASILVNKRTISIGHHGAGKDAILAALLLWACYARNMLCIVISATERQLLGQVWAELTRFWNRSDELGGKLFVGELRIGGEKRIVAMTSGSTSRLTGWHNYRGTGVFVAISESQAEQVGDTAFDAAEGNTAEDESKIVVVGNPVEPSGRFYEASKKPTWSLVQISALDHPNVREQRVVIPGGPAPSWPAEIEREYGIDSAFYVSRVLGAFPAEGTIDTLFRRQWLEDAYKRHEADGTELLQSPTPALALDVARSIGRDESVCAIAQGARVLSLDAWRSRDLVETTARFLHHADRVRLNLYAFQARRLVIHESVIKDRDALEAFLKTVPAPHPRLVIDAPAIGSGAVDEARRRGRAVREHWGWNPATNDRLFANRRAECYWGVRTELEAGRLALPRDAKLHEEALAIEWSQNAKGKIIMISKDDLRSKIKRSPDRLDAVVMALAETLHVGAQNARWGTYAA